MPPLASSNFLTSTDQPDNQIFIIREKNNGRRCQQTPPVSRIPFEADERPRAGRSPEIRHQRLRPGGMVGVKRS